MSIKNKAMLVKLSISQWYNKVIDKRVTNEVAIKYSLSNNEDQYVKRLIPSAALKEIQSAITELRDYHNSNTLPWQQDSIRILPTTKYLDYVKEMRARINLFEHRVNAFIAKYPDWVEAAKQSKKQLFDSTQYPSAGELKEKFACDTAFFPFPDSGDFRLDIDKGELDEIKRRTDEAIKQTMADASRHLVARIRDRLQVFYDAVVEPTKVFRDTTVTSVLETVILAEEMNLVSDANVTLACSATRAVFDERTTPEALRTNFGYRKKLADGAKEILDALKGL